MRTPEQATTPGDKFDQTYPDELPDRLGWLSNELKINRPELLRLMGLPEQEAARHRHSTWKAITKKFEDEAWAVEELLCHLISLFNYDWPRLANYLRRPATSSHAGERSRVRRMLGTVERLKITPEWDREDEILSAVARGGLDALIELVQSLSRVRTKSRSSA